MAFWDNLTAFFDRLLGKTVSPLPDEQGVQRYMFNKPTPTPMTTATPTSMPTPTLLPEAPTNPYMGMLSQYFPSNQVNNASNVMFRESSFNPNLINPNRDRHGSQDFGLFQVNDYWQRENLANQGLTPADVLDPETAIKFAAWLYGRQGWQPWVAARNLGL